MYSSHKKFKKHKIVFLVLQLILLQAVIKAQEEDTDEEIPVIEGTGTITIQEDKGILILNKDNFDHVISTKPLVLVEFYAPWCGHCKALVPEYEAAAQELLPDDVRLGMVDCTVEMELAKRYEVTGFPTLKLFKKGAEEPIDYEGARTSSGIVEFMKMHADPNYKPPPSSVIDLTTSTFDEFVESHEIALVEFFTPWCGHCKQLAPEYEAAAKVLDGEIPLAKVDATTESELAKKYDVTGYPTLFIFRKSRFFKYEGPREKAGIVDYMREQADSPSKDVKSSTHVKNRIKKMEPYIFAFFEEENDFYKEYIASANELRGKFIFIHTFDSALAKKSALSANTLNIFHPERYFSKFEKKNHVLSEATSSQDDITSWITKNSIPLVGQRSKANMGHLYTKFPLAVIYYDVSFDHQYIKDTQIIRNKILSVANKHPDITFAICNEEEFVDELKEVGLEDSGESVNVAIFGERNTKYPMEPDDDFDSESLEEFIIKFKKGKLKPHLRSQPIPKRQEGPVKVIVAKNFEKELLHNDKDVLIEFYAPWCGHCKNLEPAYKKLAKHYKKDKSIVIAKMDATANDVPPPFEVKGFPTIFFLEADDKENPIPFSGERTFEGFKSFIEEHSITHERDEL